MSPVISSNQSHVVTFPLAGYVRYCLIIDRVISRVYCIVYCLSQRAGSGTILTCYGIFIPAAEAAGPRNVRFDGGLLKVGVY